MKTSKSKVLDAAVDIAAKHGLRGMTRERVAALIHVSAGTINYHFKTMNTLRGAVIRAAITFERLPIIADALSLRHPAALKASEELKQRAVRTLAAG